MVVVANEVKNLGERLDKVDGLMTDSGHRLRRLELVQAALGEERLRALLSRSEARDECVGESFGLALGLGASGELPDGSG